MGVGKRPIPQRNGTMNNWVCYKEQTATPLVLCAGCGAVGQTVWEETLSKVCVKCYGGNNVWHANRVCSAVCSVEKSGGACREGGVGVWGVVHMWGQTPAVLQQWCSTTTGSAGRRPTAAAPVLQCGVRGVVAKVGRGGVLLRAV